LPHRSGLRRMILKIPIGRVDSLIDAAQIGVAVGRPRWAIGLRRRGQEDSQGNAGGNRGVNKVPHSPVSMLCEDGIVVKYAGVGAVFILDNIYTA
jgi:hypothetical protein